MTDARHLMIRTDGNGAESLLECTVEGCGRRVVLDHLRVRLVVLDHGSGTALHHGSTGLVAVSGAIQPGLPEAT